MYPRGIRMSLGSGGEGRGGEAGWGSRDGKPRRVSCKTNAYKLPEVAAAAAAAAAAPSTYLAYSCCTAASVTYLLRTDGRSFCAARAAHLAEEMALADARARRDPLIRSLHKILQIGVREHLPAQETRPAKTARAGGGGGGDSSNARTSRRTNN